MEVKGIFLDVDGTLLSFNTHRVPDSALDALHKVHDSGVKVIIATGRPFSDLLEIEDVPYDAVIALNGAESRLRDGSVIYRKPIDLCDFRKIHELSLKHGFPLAVETDRGLRINKIDNSVISLSELVNHPLPEVVDIEKEFLNDECCQLCIYCDQETEKKVMSEVPDLTASRWNPLFADVNVSGTDKASGLMEMCTYYGFDISQVLAFGDGGNDVSMLKAAGIGIAMGNASETVRSSADYVTDDVDDDGIRNAIWNFCQPLLK